MSVPVEAQSLSALTGLLANPPQYPRNPTHEVRDPLVLYIVRVPGSKDVFLSPLKPPTKSSISLEAIQSSLYYLHLETDEDEEIKKSIDEERKSEDVERVNPPIQRKPLPSVPHANYPPSARPLPPPKSYPSYQPGLEGTENASQSERYAARGSHINFGVEDGGQCNNGNRNSSSPRRLPQRPYLNVPAQHSQTSFDGSPLESENRRPSLTQPSYSSERLGPHLSPHRVNQSPAFSPQSTTSLAETNSVDTFGSTGSFEHSRRRCNITLIRRDPVSGNQWNVGNIALNQSGVSNMPLNAVSVQMTTPGYSRFVSVPEAPRPGTGLSDATSIKEALTAGTLFMNKSLSEERSNHGFQRTAEYRQQAVNSRPLKLHRRMNSSDSITKPPSPTKQIRQMYSFMSPWQGICTFSNGIDGKSLKCRHTLSTSTLPEEDTSMNIAELRFNLPWSIVASIGEKEMDDTLPISQLIEPRSGKNAFKRGIKHIKNLSVDRRNGTSPEDVSPVAQDLPKQSRLDSELDRLSLKLGREKAGGGFKGTSAKLGKLIIEDEGLKMCDLLIAMCMGVWWQHYERRGD